ncbi:2-dehydropantoate 2-reductase [Streptobacillus moniliformis]|uniref:2-dehydropantoate 2-reductase n=1 Tax=Streptobacillus moniliformis TaxID=34105 RepID=UPI0007E323A7|nr:2-dehydropantoate 2-reductase [Streptobacillus moniliformis]QXW65061.1 2-dehydropantoate 2-reductase [Streptobacillus moniliformis]
MKVIIAGTGAMGATYGSMLKKSGNEVIFLDLWQENVEAINKNGINFKNLGVEENIKAEAYLPSGYKESADLIVVFTKSMQLKQMLNDVKHLISEKTSVLCLLNGLGHIDTLKEFVKPEQILMGVTVLTAGMKGAGMFEVTNYGKTEIQNISEAGKENAIKVVECINNSGLPTVYSEDILFSIWRKACINGTMNACCALLDCNMLELGKIEKSRELLGKIVEEFAAVAKKEGTTLDVEEITNLVCWFTTEEFQGVKHYPSMHQDLIQKRRLTEIDYLNGYVSKKGKEYGLDTSFCDLITILVHGRESVLIGG